MTATLTAAIAPNSVLEAADLLEAAASRLATYGWHNGVDWIDCKQGHSIYARPAWGQAHLYLAMGCDPYLRINPGNEPPPVVAEAEQQFAAFLVAHGEAAQWDRDGFLDAETVIDAYESDPLMTGAEVAERFRDCAAEIRTRLTTTRNDAKDVA